MPCPLRLLLGIPQSWGPAGLCSFKPGSGQPPPLGGVGLARSAGARGRVGGGGPFLSVAGPGSLGAGRGQPWGSPQPAGTRRSLESPASTPAFLGPACGSPGPAYAGCGVPTAGSRSRAGHDLGARSKSLVPGGGTRLPLPGPLRPGHEAQCSQGLPPCCGALVSPRLPSRRTVPTQGPRGQSASLPLSRAPSCAQAAGSRQAAPRSAVTVVSVLASPASTTSGGPQAVLRPRTEPCPLPTVPEVLQLSDALRDDILPELGVRLEDHEGGSSGCGEGLLGGGCQVGLAFGRTAGTGPRAPRLLQGPRGRIVPLGHHASPPLS